VLTLYRVPSLVEIFDEACRIAKDFFYQELDEASFSPDSWAEAEKLKAKTFLPLPRSNSLMAKKMRFATGLKILGEALSTHVLQAVYITDVDNKFCDALETLSEHSPEQEAHARAVILHLAHDQHWQRGCGEARVIAAARETANKILRIVPVDKREDFVAQLKSFCGMVLMRWLPLQRLRQHVTVDVDADAGEDWQLLPFPGPEITSVQPQKGSSSKGGGGGGNGNGKNTSSSDQKQQQQQQQSKVQSIRLGEDDEVYEIWPAFKHDTSYLCQGYILTEELPKRAVQEEEELRRSERKLSRRSNSDATNGQSRSAKNMAFLSSGNGKSSGAG
jgi:hypothetical protein